MTTTLNYYIGIMLGSYGVIWIESIGGHITWQTPLYWAVVWLVCEVTGWLVRRAWRRRKASHAAVEATE